MKLISLSRTKKLTLILLLSFLTCVLVLTWLTGKVKRSQPMPLENSPLDRQIMDELNRKRVDMENEQMLRIIRQHFIVNPSMAPYNLDNPGQMEFSSGQAPFVDNRLGFLEGGFYVECGALDGEKRSNSLFLERHRHWNGLLIEADPSNYAILKQKNRKGFIMNACIGPYPYPAKLRFNKASNVGRVVHDSSVERWLKQWNIAEDIVEVQCFPLYSILLAINQTTVDFFSLDVEGDELRVLKTIPFDKINIRMITVEYINQPGTLGDLNQFMVAMGYEPLIKMHKDDGTVTDIIYKKRDVNS